MRKTDRNSESQIPIFPEWFYDTDCNMNMLIEDGIRKVNAILNMDSAINYLWIFLSQIQHRVNLTVTYWA